MRQAGRYHSHYQALRAKYLFAEICKTPAIASEAALGPMRDFGYDAAILFSDLLFPLEAMGMGLRYDEGPVLGWHIKDMEALKKLKTGVFPAQELGFQAEALKLTRKALNQEKGMIGFVGGPFTLFVYAVHGTHQGELESAKAGLHDGRFGAFYELLLDLLVATMVAQTRAGADTVLIIDTAAGALDPKTYRDKVVPGLARLMHRYLSYCPQSPISYYSKGTGPEHWDTLKDLPISCLGIDWSCPIEEVLKKYSNHWAIQGNIDPNWLTLSPDDLERNIRKYFQTVLTLPLELRKGWICGLGHGVLPKTPEDNVRRVLSIQKEMFS